MASEFGPASPAVRLSGKEVSGLAARVLVAALVPPGATGGTSEACEFLELTEGGALSRLDADKEALLQVEWTTPAVTSEAADAAILDFGGRPAHHAGPAVADWLAAMAIEHGCGAVAVENIASAELLAAGAQLLARQGISSATLTQAEDGAVRFRLVLAGGGEWVQLRWPEGKAPIAMDVATNLDALRAHAETVVALAAGIAGGQAAALAARDIPGATTGRAVIVAFLHEGAVEADASMAEAASQAGVAVMSSARYAQLKSDVLARGWPMDRPLWERLMAFADRSLIPTSERSRQGAG